MNVIFVCPLWLYVPLRHVAFHNVMEIISESPLARLRRAGGELEGSLRGAGREVE